MAPKKGQKMSLGAFLDDATLGSWADEMESLPTAPAFRTEEERARDTSHTDFSSKPDRAPLPLREEVPLPTAPPYTVFVGNLAFDMSDSELGHFFSPYKTVSVKIITDRDGKPKGFGYVEFDDLEGLKYALTKSGATLSHRTVRINVADPPKERERGGLGGRDTLEDEKLAGNWRREGPLESGARRGPGFRSRDKFDAGDFDGPKRAQKFQSSQEFERSELNEDWRGSARGPLPPMERERERKAGWSVESPSIADTEDVWTKGSKFRSGASEAGSIGRKFAPGSTSPADEGDWRFRSRPTGRSPTSSTPPTPVRKKLELLPRSGDPPAASIQLASPLATPIIVKPSPFGTAKPVDVSIKEKEVEERLAREREETVTLGRHPMSREPSRQASIRESHPLSRETSRQAIPRGAQSQSQSSQGRKVTSPSGGSSPINTTPNVRSAFSFASAAKRAAESAEPPSLVEKEFSPSEEARDGKLVENTPVQQLGDQMTQIAV